MTRFAPLLACLALAACEGGLPAPGSPGGPPVAAFASAPGPAPVCGLSGAALGQPIGSSAGYTVHDTAPGSTGPRTHHVTGFSDGCARAVTASLVLLGEVSTYETSHYAAHADDTAPTDLAYEEIKARVCGVPRGTSCGGALDRLAADTLFLSLYPVFGEDAHSDLLLHGGEVAAVDP